MSDLRRESGRRTATGVRMVVVVLVALAAHRVWANGGGGSAALYSLDPTSPSLAFSGFSPADILMDDAINDGVLTRALPASGLRLLPGDNLKGLSGGRDNGIPVMIPFGNRMHWPYLRYQFSIDRNATDDFTSSALPLPHEFPRFFPAIRLRTESPPQNHPADVLDNVRVPVRTRFNFRMVEHGEKPGPSLELVAQDNMDALTNVGAIGGGPDVMGPNGPGPNGELDIGSTIFFVVESRGPSGLNGATIYRKVGTDAPGDMYTEYATPAQLGLTPLDQIDAISVWDQGTLGVFDAGDGVVFSLAPNSPSLVPLRILPGDANQVPLDEGAIYLALPGAGVVEGLPKEYFSIRGGNLDAIIAIDPREDMPSCLGQISWPVTPAGGLTLSRSLVELPPNGMSTYVTVAINDPRGLQNAVIRSFSVSATNSGGAAWVDVAQPCVFPFGCYGGPQGGRCDCRTRCGGGAPNPPCPAPTATFSACNLDVGGPPGNCGTPLTFMDLNACLGEFIVQAGPAPGDTVLSISATVETAGTEALYDFGPVELTVHVISDCNGNGVDDPVEVKRGTSPDCNANSVPDACDIASGTSADCNANGVPDECDLASGLAADCNANGTLDVCDIASGASADCNANGVPDECDLASGLAADCNANGIPDSCDVANGTSNDCIVGPPRSTVRASLGTAGAQGDGPALGSLSVSDSGRYVVFTSRAGNLVPGDTNGTYDAFVRDRDADGNGVFDEPGGVATILVSARPDGAPGNGASNDPSGAAFLPSQQISADGRFVVFYSNASDLVAGDTNGVTDVFVRDRDTDANGIFDEPGAVATTRILAPGGAQANGVSRNATISADGRWVAFVSYASNLVTPDLNPSGAEVYVWERTTGALRRVSISSSGAQPASGSSDDPTISADGRYVTFDSSATSLVAGDTNGALDVFRHDRDTDGDGIFDEAGAIATVRVSVDSTGAQAGRSDYPSMSRSGRYVAFRNAGPLVPEDTNSVGDVYLRDADGGPATLRRVSVGTGGVQATGAGIDTRPGSVSPDGSYVTFYSNAANLVPGDTNGTYDVFVHRVASVQTIAGSLSGAGVFGNDVSVQPVLSGDARSIVFLSNATNLSSGDTNGQTDAFVRAYLDCNANGVIDDFEDPRSLGCYGNGVPDECEADCDADLLADSCAIRTGRAADVNGNGVPDVCDCADWDGDGYTAASCPGSSLPADCNDANNTSWARPGEATDLDFFSDRSTITWSAPASLGGISVAYDTLRSTLPDDFGAGAVCIEPNGTDTTSVDAATPIAGTPFFYLAVVQNGCPGSLGRNAGADSRGNPRMTRACP